MPSVGTLNLQVQSNAGTVGDSLGQLAGALERIRKAVPENGLGLSKIGTDISNFVKQIKEIESISTVSKTLESIGNGMVGMAKFLKFSTDSVKESTDGIKESVSSINTKPAVDAINDLKGAIGSGLNLGTAGVQLKNIQIVLSKDWNLEGAKAASSVLKTIGEGAKSLSSKGLGTHAKDISALAAALQEFATATEAVKTAVGEGQNGIDSPNMKYESLGKDGAAGYAQGIESGKEQVAEASANMINAGLDSGAEAQDSHSPSRKYMKLGEYGAEGYIEGFKDKYAEAAQTVSDFIRGLLSHATEGTAQQFGQIASVAIRQAFSKAFDNIGIPEAKLKIMQGAVDLAASVTNGMVSSAKGNYERVATEAAGFIRESIIAASNNVFKDATDKTGLSETESAIRQTNETLQDYQGSVQEATSAINGLSSEEANLTQNTNKAAEAIQRLLDRLNEVKKDKGFGDRFSWSLGIGRQTISAAESAAVFEADSVREYNIELRETGDIITSVLIPRFMEMYQVMSMMAYEFGSFMREGARLMSGESFLALTDGRTPGQMLLGDGSEPETFLSTWVRTGEEFKTDWVYFTSDIADQWRAAWSPDFILGGWSNVPQRMSHMLLGDGGRTGQLLLGDGGVAPENMLSTRVDYSEQWRQDWTDGSDWKPDWIVGDGKVSEAVDEIHEATGATEEFADSIEHLRTVAGDKEAYNPAIEFARKWNASKPKGNKFAEETNTIPYIDNLIKNASEIDLMNMKIQSMTDSLYEGAASGKMTGEQIANMVMQIQKAKEKVIELEVASKHLLKRFNELVFGTGGLRGAFARMFPTLSKLVKRFKSMIVSRTIRYMIRELAKGFSEGVQNVYQYSKAVGTSLAPAMDQAATALLQMKNSIGAAMSPLIQALVPVLKTVVGYVIQAVNWFNQLFALLRGQSTWTEAVEYQTEAYKDNSKAAKSAAKEAKDLLADWDELNIIQSESGGGGSGSSSSNVVNYEEMFHEVSEFGKDVKDIVGWIKDNFELIKGIAIAIGAAVIGWKLSRTFSNALHLLNSLVGNLTGIVVGLQLTWEGAYNAGLNGGFDAMTGITTLGGVLLTTVSAALMGYKFAGPWGAVIGGASGLIVSLATAVTAYYDGERTRRYRSKWGKLHLTDEEINDLVDSQVTAEVLLSLDVMNTSIVKRGDAKRKANETIEGFSKDLETAKFLLDTDSSEEGVKDALASAQEAIKTIQASLDADKEGLKLSFTKFTYKDAQGNNVTSELYSSLMEGNYTLDKFFTDMGNDIASFIAKGFEEGLSEEEMLMAMDLMETFNSIVNNAESNYKAKKHIREAEKEMDQLKDAYDLETAQSVFARQQERLSEYKQTVANQMNEDLDTYYRNLEYYKQIQKYYTDKNDTKKAQKYQDFIDSTNLAIQNTEGWLKQMENGTYNWDADQDYGGMYKRMRDMWFDKFSQWYSEEFYNSLFSDEVESPFKDNPTAASIMSEFNFSRASFYSDDQIAKYLNYVVGKYNGDQEQALQEVQEKFPEILNEATISKYFPKTYGKETGDIQESIFGMLLSGVNEESKQWASMLEQNRRNYGSEFDNVYEQSFGSLKDLYESMIEDMFAGATRESMLKKYSKNLNLAEMFMNFFGDEFGRPTTETKEAKQNEYWWQGTPFESWESFKDWNPFEGLFSYNVPEEPVVETVEAPVEISNMDELKRDIEEAMSDGVMETSEAFDLMLKYGINEYDQALKELQYNLDEEGANLGKMIPWRTTAHMGGSSVNYGGTNEMNAGEPAEAIDYTQMTTSVKNGTTQANEDVVGELRTIVSQLTRLLAKEWKVDLSPTSSVGRGVERSAAAWDKVIGGRV